MIPVVFNFVTPATISDNRTKKFSLGVIENRLEMYLLTIPNNNNKNNNNNTPIYISIFHDIGIGMKKKEKRNWRTIQKRTNKNDNNNIVLNLLGADTRLGVMRFIEELRISGP